MIGVAFVASWLTPAVLFCLLNLIIGTIFVISGLHSRSSQPKSSASDAVSPPQLVRAPSLFERVNSFKLSFSRDQNQDRSRQQSPEGNDLHVERRSKSETREKAHDTAPVGVMKKSASEKVSAAVFKEEVGGGDEAVDARADDFISRFRQQLKMQRLDSLLRYKEMLKGGGSN